MTEADLGEYDLDCADDCTADFRVASGRLALAQALYRRWTTDRGTLIGDPNYGTNITDFINEDVNPRDLAWVISIACDEAKKDERVQAIKGTAEMTDTGVMNLVFEVTDAAGPFLLTLNVSSVTVNLLSVEE